MSKIKVKNFAELTSAIANATGGEVIELPKNHVWVITELYPSSVNALPLVEVELTIDGQGTILRRDDSAPEFRFFEVSANGSLTLQNMILENGLQAASPSIHGIYNEGTNLTVSNCLFREFDEDGNGYILLSKLNADAEVTLVDTNFVSNGAGCVSIDTGKRAVLRSCDFVSNVSVYEVAFTQQEATLIEGCNFIDNSAGSLFTCLDEVLSMVNCTFEGNAAENKDFARIAGDARLIQCDFYNNTVYVSVGGESNLLYLDHTGKMLFESCRFYNNVGRLAIETATQLRNCTFSNNQTTPGEGIIDHFYDLCVIRYCIFNNNQPLTIHSSSPDICDARYNTWENCKGPRSEQVSGNVLYTPTLTPCSSCQQVGIQACCLPPAR